MHKNFQNNTVKQLRDLAKSKGLKGYYKLNKSNLIDLIKKTYSLICTRYGCF